MISSFGTRRGRPRPEFWNPTGLSVRVLCLCLPPVSCSSLHETSHGERPHWTYRDPHVRRGQRSSMLPRWTSSRGWRQVTVPLASEMVDHRPAGPLPTPDVLDEAVGG